MSNKNDYLPPKKVSLFKRRKEEIIVGVIVGVIVTVIGVCINAIGGGIGDIFGGQEVDITLNQGGDITPNQGGDINIYTNSEEFINEKISINLKQPKVEKNFSQSFEEEEYDLDSFDWEEYNSFGYQRRLVFKGYPMVSNDSNYLYINNEGKFSESDVTIQFESDNIYFESKDNKYASNIDVDNEPIETETKYEFQLTDYKYKVGHTTLRMKINPGENIHPGLSEKISLDDIFNNEIAWFYNGSAEEITEETVTVNVTISGEKCEVKTFTINLNIAGE